MKYFKFTFRNGALVASALFMGFLYSCGSSNDQGNTAINQDASENEVPTEGEPVLSLAEYFEESIAGEKLTMVDFYAEWCGPCKRMAPFVNEIKRENSDIVNVIQIDAEKYVDIAQRYNLEGYPTLIFFKNGKIVEKMLGGLDKQQILELVNRLK
jgi:thioredoxin 1